MLGVLQPGDASGGVLHGCGCGAVVTRSEVRQQTQGSSIKQAQCAQSYSTLIEHTQPFKIVESP